jgi:hypothetical protein
VRKILTIIVDTSRSTEELEAALSVNLVLKLRPSSDDANETAELVPLEGQVANVLDLDELSR